MRLRPLVTVLIVCALAGSVVAQQPPQPVRREQRVEPGPPEQPPRPAPAPVVVTPAQLSNIRFEVVITETGATPAKKTVSMIVADAGRGSVRTTTDGKGPGSTGPGNINVDARPRIERNGLIRANIVIEYRFKVTVQFDSLLESGKTVVVSEAPDPGSDATVTVAVTATVLK